MQFSFFFCLSSVDLRPVLKLPKEGDTGLTQRVGLPKAPVSHGRRGEEVSAVWSGELQANSRKKKGMRKNKHKKTKPVQLKIKITYKNVGHVEITK